MRAIILSLCVVVGACGSEKQAAGPAPEEFVVATPTIGAVVEREYVGQVRAVRHVELRARARGVIEGTHVDEGQSVQAGQLLFSLSTRALRQDLERARAAVASAVAELRAAQIEFDNTRMLYDRQVVSNAEFELAAAQVAALEARLREARAEEGHAELNLSFGEVRAPFAGVVNRLPRRVGSLVSEDELLTTLSDTSEMHVYFQVGEQEYLALSRRPQEQSAGVTLKLADGSVHPGTGRLDAVESEFDRATGTIAFRARFPNPDGLLKHGASGKIVLRESLDDAVVVPQQSTFEVQEHLFVFRVDEEDVVRATRLVPRARLADTFVIESGLTAGDRFVVEGAQRLRDGQRILTRPRATGLASSR